MQEKRHTTTSDNKSSQSIVFELFILNSWFINLTNVHDLIYLARTEFCITNHHLKVKLSHNPILGAWCIARTLISGGQREALSPCGLPCWACHGHRQGSWARQGVNHHRGGPSWRRGSWRNPAAPTPPGPLPRLAGADQVLAAQRLQQAVQAG